MKKMRRRRRRLLCETATGESDTKEEITDNNNYGYDNVNNNGRLIKIFVMLSDVVLDYTTLLEYGQKNNKQLK